MQKSLGSLADPCFERFSTTSERSFESPKSFENTKFHRQIVPRNGEKFLNLFLNFQLNFRGKFVQNKTRSQPENVEKKIDWDCYFMIKIKKNVPEMFS